MITQLELEEKIAAEDEGVLESLNLVMIQCVGCRNEDRNYCSRVCCSQAVKNALRLKEKNPDMDIYVLFRDMRTYGLKEDYYRLASDNDVRFIRYVPEDPPQVQGAEVEGREVIKVAVPDPILGETLEIDADTLVLSAAVVPAPGTEELAGQFKVTLSPDSFFKEAHAKLKPVEFATDGVFLCGMAQYPKHITESINQAYGAAGRVLTLLSRDTVVASGAICEVNENACVSCGACITACTYGAIEFKNTPAGRKASVNPVLCKGGRGVQHQVPHRGHSAQAFHGRRDIQSNRRCGAGVSAAGRGPVAVQPGPAAKGGENQWVRMRNSSRESLVFFVYW